MEKNKNNNKICDSLIYFDYVYSGIAYQEHPRLIMNSKDDEAFKRVINFPSRGIGAVSMERIISICSQKGVPLSEGVMTISAEEFGVRPATLAKIKEFTQAIAEIRENVYTSDAYEIAQMLDSRFALCATLASCCPTFPRLSSLATSTSSTRPSSRKSEFTVDMRRVTRGTSSALDESMPDFGANYAEIFNTRISDWRSEKIVLMIQQQYRTSNPASTVSDDDIVATLVDSKLELQRNSRITKTSIPCFCTSRRAALVAASPPPLGILPIPASGTICCNACKKAARASTLAEATAISSSARGRCNTFISGTTACTPSGMALFLAN